MILKGSEIIIGGNIIIPMDMRIDAVTMSIIRNGRKSIKPISKARRSSEIIKDGINTRRGTAISFSKGPSSLSSVKRIKSSSRAATAGYVALSPRPES